MGISMRSSFRFRWLWGRLFRFAVCICMPVLALGGLGFSGCESKKGSGTISAKEFLSAENSSIRALTNQLELLKAITPSVLNDELVNQTATTAPMGKVTEDRLMVYEALRGALVSTDICRDCPTTGRRSRIDLHFNREGFEEELLALGAVGPSVSLDVAPVEVNLGGKRFVIAFENASNSLLAFQSMPGYRTAADQLGEDDDNFGHGNDLILNVVVSGAEMARQLGFGLTSFRPIVTQISAFGPTQILVFFSNVRALHVLDLRVELELLDWNLRDGEDESLVPTEVLKGSLRTFPNPDPELLPLPFLSFGEIQEVTQTSDTRIDNFPLILVPTDGSALLFDQGSASLLRVIERDNGTGAVFLAVRGLRIVELLGRPDLQMGVSWYHAKRPSILMMEEETNNILEYDYGADDISVFSENSIEIFVSAEDFLFRRDPSVNDQNVIPSSGDEPILVIGNDILENRLAFDRGRDHLLAINYDSGVVVVVAKREDFQPATLRELADLTYLEALVAETSDAEDVRAWDAAANALLEIGLRHTTLPVIAREDS